MLVIIALTPMCGAQARFYCTMLVRSWIFLVHLTPAQIIMVHKMPIGKLSSSNFQFC